VVVGCRDPKPHVSGALERLMAAGIKVTIGVCADEALALIADFTKHIRTGLPYAILKAAITLDGRTATRTGDSRWITGESARTEAHRMRARADAVLVGVGTVLRDDPELTVRSVEGMSPTCVILDTHLRTPTTSRVLGTRERRSVLIVHGGSAKTERRQLLADAGATLIEVEIDRSLLALPAVLRSLGRKGIVRLLVEGGSTVHGNMLDQGLFDEAAIFVAPRILGDPEALPLARGRAIEHIAKAWELDQARMRALGEDFLIEGRPTRKG
jgi:diaminohydroxyphosphoribosylaminopyrimidine deaminase/5-amino-6-(5-phosphoribosylamino)uracil reductase